MAWIDAKTLQGFIDPQNGNISRVASIRRGEGVFDSDVPLYTHPAAEIAAQPKYDPATQPGDPAFDGAEAYQAHLEATCAARLETLERICEGGTDEMIEGGWTANGIRRYAKEREAEIAALRERIAGMEKDADAGKNRRFEIRQGGMTVAATEGPGVDAYRDAVHYFWQYQQDATEDEPVEMVELTTVMRIDTPEKQG